MFLCSKNKEYDVHSSVFANSVLAHPLWFNFFVILFQEDVDTFMKQPGNETADAVLRKLDEQYQKYKYMELNLSQKKLRYHKDFFFLQSYSLNSIRDFCGLLSKQLSTTIHTFFLT